VPGVSAVGIEVEDCEKAHDIAVAKEQIVGKNPDGSDKKQGGAISVLKPCVIEDPKNTNRKVIIAEIDLYSEKPAEGEKLDAKYQSSTVLRFVQYVGFTEQEKRSFFLPRYVPVEDPHPLDYGITRIDHVVGNVHRMDKVVSIIKAATGFHTFSKFTKEEIQTPWTALNSEVLSNFQENVLLPINEPAPGKKESQIEEYLKAYNGPGVQHLALKSSNIFRTIKAMRERSDVGFEFIPTPKTYYENPEIVKIMKENLTEEECDAIMELSILIDKDEEGLLLQIFTKPLFDRPTLFVEIIQRKCSGQTIDIPGCGGFGRGNFKALFESIERMQADRGGLLDASTTSAVC